MKIKVATNTNFRKVLFLAFAFTMTATLSFLAVHNMLKTEAASFSAGDIMSDAVMANYTSMSESDINNFMHSKNSCNDTNLAKAKPYIAQGYTYQTKNGHFVCLADQTFNGQSAAHIIWQAAQDYRINPQVLLVLLQKEQSLITDTWPNDRQIRKATGFACTDSAPCDESKSGFENQIRKAAALYRAVLDGGWTNYPVGNNYVQYNPNKSCGGTTVYIANRATSALYRYTPYQPNSAALSGNSNSCSAYGNLNFWKYFTSWFGDTHAITDIKSVYMPEGTYTLNTTAGKVMSFTGSGNGSAAQVANNDNSDLTKFTLERDDYRYFKLKNVASGRYLDVSGANTADGTQVQLWDSNNSCAQKWSIEIINDKSYRLRNACSFKSLDVSGAAVNKNGTKIQIWSNNSSTAQQWVLTNTSAAPIKNGTYNIKSTGNKFLSSDQEKLAQGTKMVIDFPTTSSAQQFKVTRSADGYYHLKNGATNQYLDVYEAKTNNGVKIELWGNNASCAQRWNIVKNGDGYRLTSACSGKSLDINEAKVSTNGTNVQLWSNNTTNAQKWYFKAPDAGAIADGTYMIQSAVNKNMYLDINGSSKAKDGTNAQIWSKNNTASQKFKITYNTSTGYYTIYNLFSKRNLDVNGAVYGKSGTNIQVWSSNNSCAQKWTITPISGTDYYRIVSACGRISLDVNGASSKIGTNVQLWSNNNTNAQKWRLIKQ